MSIRTRYLRLPAPRTVLLLALLLPVFAWAPLTHPGFFQFHSGFLSVFTLNDLAGHLTDPAWTSATGVVYDLLRGERAVPYLIGVLITGLGASPEAAVKAVFALSFVAGSTGMALWVKRRLGPWPALVSACTYVFSPIALATVYVRGALAEAVLLGALPWVILAAERAAGGNRAGAMALAVTMAALAWTQPGLAAWMAILVLAFVLLSRPSEQGTRPAFSWTLAAWGIGLAAGLLGLAPLIVRHGFGGGAAPVFADHLVYLHQLLGGWGYGMSVPGPDDSLAFDLGFPAVGLALVAFALAGRSHEDAAGPAEGDDRAEAEVHDAVAVRRIGRFAVGAVLVLVFLASTLAEPVWRVLPFLSRSLAYPWQLLLLAGPWLAWLAGLGARRLIDLLPRVEEFAEPPAQTAAGAVPVAACLLLFALLPAYQDLRPVTTRLQVGNAPLAVFGDNEIVLLAVALEGKVSPGEEVVLDVRWQALRPLTGDYTAFFHVIGPGGLRYAQRDTVPQDGKLPTTRWQPGQIVADRYVARVAADAPPGEYTYWLGFYQFSTGERLKTGADDKFVAPAVASAEGIADDQPSRSALSGATDTRR